MRSKDRRRGLRSLMGLLGSALAPLDDGLRPRDMCPSWGARRWSCVARSVLMSPRNLASRCESWFLLFTCV